MNWHATLSEALQPHASRHICALDAGAGEIAHALQPQASIELCTPHTQRATPAHLALVMDALNDLNTAQARTLLARVRDFIAPRIVVVAEGRCRLDRLGFLAIGYEALGVDATENIAIYHFDLNTYKQVPDWLNARYWAHPERWKA